MATKECITCAETKPHTEFWVKRGKLFGECKVCGRARNKDWHRANGHAIRPRQARARRKYLDGMDWARRILASAKWRATRYGIPFNLEVADIVVPTHCPILGVPLVIHRGHGSLKGGQPNSPSLDRIDNAKGYVRGNVIVVSYRANRIKCDATVNELEALAAFYRKLENERSREGDGGRSLDEVDGLSSALPPMFPEKKEEERPMSARNADI